MAISFDKVLGIHPQALAFRGLRAEVLAGNLANVDTPGFKARDIEFSAVLNHQLNQPEGAEATQRALKLTADTQSLMYRIPHQQSSDGNTVELGVEQSSFARNSLDFQTSLTFVRKKLSGLELAIRGGM
ncbi:flagellar basal body rod protein FlgB [Endozoicomonas sp. GU-1]|uniref:flagellar basal body rod protein FlgB n=1 Tax=Endozoicomonas sp. GU-1 TaxID=3009078 RepID=UPI0022B4BA64|nr:flagellar basal body rod protein FlgB [Endozoicomonas sp. GU-1]WBA82518.1 flagellar basal body rod protein FlgB [Endozoicomonas sp. GU-1]WBA85449.1 flagellar basal body rod protein FlgB [Endozoicomonas sp. GU-1]